MADIRIRSAFGFSIARLQVYCRRFDGALLDESVGREVRRHLPPEFPPTFKARMARLEELAVLQAAAAGQGGELTTAKRLALGDVVLLSGSARRAARVEYARVPAILHGEFFVGGTGSKSVAALVANAEKLAANCTTRAEALAPHGWSAEETKLLVSAIDTLKRADADHEAATNLKEGYTAEQTTVANDLYRMCRAIQNVARVVYAKSQARVDPSVVAGRAHFMLGEFPPRPGATPDVPDDGAGVPAVVVPNGAAAATGETSTVTDAPATTDVAVGVAGNSATPPPDETSSALISGEAAPGASASATSIAPPFARPPS